MRVFRHRDFTILWLGALISFFGGNIQSLAQGWFVYDITGDKSKLALVTFLSFLPVTFLGPIAGAIADTVNKRTALIWCQALLGVYALFLAVMTHFGWVTYGHILVVALLGGFVQAVEMPTRQSIVGRVVPPEDLPQAVPMQAMTFNLARIAGPALGGLLLSWFGVAFCYLVNGITYLGLIASAVSIKTNLKAEAREPQPVWDIVTEGALYTWRNRGLRVLFLLEVSVAMLALQYALLMPALAKDIWGLNERGLGFVSMLIGVGAVLGLISVAHISSLHRRVNAIRIAITLMGLSLLVMGTSRVVWLSYAAVFVAGLCTLVQFNTTNTLFQLLSPPKLRGRVLAMHMWALSGLGPVGALGFGILAERTSMMLSLSIAGVLTLLCGVWGWTQTKVLMASIDAHLEAAQPIA